MTGITDVGRKLRDEEETVDWNKIWLVNMREI